MGVVVCWMDWQGVTTEIFFLRLFTGRQGNVQKYRRMYTRTARSHQKLCIIKLEQKIERAEF